MATATATTHRARIAVQLPTNASARQGRELGAFARYCVQRIEKELGARQHWAVGIALTGQGYTALVEVQHPGLVLEARGTGPDGPLAIWDAMCRIEQALRDASAAGPRHEND